MQLATFVALYETFLLYYSKVNAFHRIIVVLALLAMEFIDMDLQLNKAAFTGYKDGSKALCRRL